MMIHDSVVMYNLKMPTYELLNLRRNTVEINVSIRFGVDKKHRNLQTRCCLSFPRIVGALPERALIVSRPVFGSQVRTYRVTSTREFRTVNIEVERPYPLPDRRVVPSEKYYNRFSNDVFRSAGGSGFAKITLPANRAH